jgi:hypothetical protein
MYILFYLTSVSVLLRVHTDSLTTLGKPSGKALWRPVRVTHAPRMGSLALFFLYQPVSLKPSISESLVPRTTPML